MMNLIVGNCQADIERFHFDWNTKQCVCRLEREKERWMGKERERESEKKSERKVEEEE